MILKRKLSALAVELSALQLCTQASTSLLSYSGRCCPPSAEALSSPSPTVWASKLSLPSDSGECDSRTVSVLCHQRSHAVITLEQAETQRSLALTPLLPPDTLLVPLPHPHPCLPLFPPPPLNLPVSSAHRVSAEQTPLLTIRTGSHFGGHSVPQAKRKYLALPAPSSSSLDPHLGVG